MAVKPAHRSHMGDVLKGRRLLKDCEQVMWVVLDKYERMPAILQLEHVLGKPEFFRLLGEVWVNVDNGEDYWPQVRKMFERTPRKYLQMLMDEDDQECFDNLPDHNIEIYRGGMPGAELCEMPAWSTSYEVAVRFAYTESPLEPIVYRAYVDKKDVYAHFCGRQEFEVLLDPEISESFDEGDYDWLEPKDVKWASRAEFYKSVQRQGIFSSVTNVQTSYIHAMQGRDHFEEFMKYRWSQVFQLRELGLTEFAETRLQTITAIYNDEQVWELLKCGPRNVNATLVFEGVE